MSTRAGTGKAIALAGAVAAFLGAFDARARGEAVEPKSGCAVAGVRVFLYDQGSAATLEVSAKLVAPSGTASCTVDWSRVVLGSPGGAAAAPTVAIAQTFVDHASSPPLMLADGLSSAIVPAWKGDVDANGKVVALRLVLEGTSEGVVATLPRELFPRGAIAGARVERRAKSAREATAKFGALGELALTPAGPGAADAFGPTDALSDATIVDEIVPTGAPPAQPLPPSIAVLGMFRETIPLRVLDLSVDNAPGWDELARYAYAAALNGDPLVASLGAHTLAWLGSGLSVQATRIAATSDGPETAAVPAAIATAVGDPDARVGKMLGGIGRFLPLGRASTFRKLFSRHLELDVARAKAARDAVFRLDGVKAEELTALAVPALLERTVPVDPPAPLAEPGREHVITPTPDDPALGPAPEASPSRGRRHGHRPAAHRGRFGLLIGALAGLGAIALALFASRDEKPRA